jgi:hypothetical protein
MRLSIRRILGAKIRIYKFVSLQKKCNNNNNNNRYVDLELNSDRKCLLLKIS